MNILLLEDEPMLSAVACEQIESRGHKVYPAFDISQAIAIMEDESIQIDMLIADQLVPDGNGSEFAIKMRSSLRASEIVVVSGQLGDSDKEMLKSNGINFYGKPSLYSEIVEDVERKRSADSQLS